MKKLGWFIGNFLVIALLFLHHSSTVMAEEIPDSQLPGTLIGEGTHFELTDSEYLNVTVDSTEPVKLMLESIPEMVTILIESVSTATSTKITLSGLLPNTKYYKYEDDYHNPEKFITDANGRYTYVQDISVPHLVFIQANASTKVILDDATGGDCSTIGVWNTETKTCTLTTDLNESIAIGSSYITLDGNGHTLRGGYIGVYAYRKRGVTVKNLNITNSSIGISFYLTSRSSIIGNTLYSNRYGIRLICSGENTIAENTIINQRYSAIRLMWVSNSNLVENNNLISTRYYGIDVVMYSGSNTFRGNTVESNSTGIYFGYKSFWKTYVYNNNFVNNRVQAYVYHSGTIHFNLSKPTGGNYWSDYDIPEEGCNDLDSDGFCDEPYYFQGGVDYLPWTEQDGWLQLCSQVPEFEITSFGPEYIWPPNRKMKEVTVSGKVILPQDCTLLGAGYSIDDEYGVYSSEGELIVDADGNFTLPLQVEAWRDGVDKDGRRYSISLFAEDEAGIGTSEILKIR